MVGHALSLILLHFLAIAPHPVATPVFSGDSGATFGGWPKPPYDAILGWILQFLIFLANLAGGAVVGVATIRGIIIYVVELLHAHGGEVPKEAIRLSLGRSLSLALEFQLGADILGTALNPSLQDILTLGAIVILRTVLNFFLGRELAEAERRARDARHVEDATAHST